MRQWKVGTEEEMRMTGLKDIVQSYHLSSSFLVHYATLLFLMVHPGKEDCRVLNRESARDKKVKAKEMKY